MIIRKQNPSETNNIIKLLQASLGESLLKKTTKIWNFKHLENPFGNSHVLLAEENDVLIGVRAFMQWRWQFQDKIWTSYRAVDTATHPDHQGKGIFKQLTLQALEDVQALGESFVFNTPNDKSRPGYLKMGWKEVGKLNVAIIPVFFYFFRVFGKLKLDKNIISDRQLDQICHQHNSQLGSQKVFFTPKSAVYLRWRYEENPMQNYLVVSSADCFVAMYVKKHQFFRELRVVEILGVSNNQIRNTVQQAIVSQALKNKCFLITTADKQLFRLGLFGKYGPILTFRSLPLSQHISTAALNIQNWKYSLGDLELF